MLVKILATDGILKVQINNDSILNYSGEKEIEFQYMIQGEKENIFTITTITGLEAKEKIYIESVKFKQAEVFFHTMALDLEGNIWIWGQNSKGELGDGTIDNNKKPKKLELGNIGRVHKK